MAELLARLHWEPFALLAVLSFINLFTPWHLPQLQIVLGWPPRIRLRGFVRKQPTVFGD